MTRSFDDTAKRPVPWTRRQVLSTASAALISSSLVARSLAAPSDASVQDLAEVKERLPRTIKIIEDAAVGGGSGQLYLSFNGRPIADVAWGKSRAGQAYTPNTLVSWASAVKPTTCTCLLKLWDQGKLDLDDKVTRFIPEFAANGKESVRIRHLLTHSAHLGGYAGPQALPPTFEELANKIIQAPRTPYRVGSGKLPPLGLGPGYNPAGIIIVAEICRRIDGRDFKDIVRKEVYEPCGMQDSWCGMPSEKYHEYTDAGRFASSYLSSEEDAVKCQPAGGGIGPSRELARFYEMLLARGTINGTRILSPQAVEAMTTPKTGLCYMGIWGLGLNLAIPENIVVPEGTAARGGSERLTDRYGPHASTRTFGHAGASGMQAFADPEFGLATAFIGRAPIQGAMYEDLGLARAT